MTPNTPTVNAEPRLFTLHEAAGRLRISVSMVRRLVKRRDLPAVTIGRRVLVDPADVEQFIAEAKGGAS